MLIVHEVMGRNCGWLTAATARAYRDRLDETQFLPEIGLTRAAKEVHGVFVPEMDFDLDAEAKRLRGVMDDVDCVNLFISKGPASTRLSKRWSPAAKACRPTRLATTNSTR